MKIIRHQGVLAALGCLGSSVWNWCLIWGLPCMQSLQVLAQAQAAHMAAQVQTAAQQQAGVQQAGGQGGDGSQSEPAGFTYRNRARRKASEKPHVSPDAHRPFHGVLTTDVMCPSGPSALLL